MQPISILCIGSTHFLLHMQRQLSFQLYYYEIDMLLSEWFCGDGLKHDVKHI